MATLYEILGLSENATSAQIEQGFVLQSEKAAGLPAEQARMRQMAIKEAFAVLSSPSRRAAYDERQQRSRQVTYEVIEKKPMPWIAIAITAIVLISGGVYIQQKQARTARLEELARQTALAEAEAEKAALLAEAEEARLARQRLADARQEESMRRNELDASRRDGERVRREMEIQVMRDQRNARDQDYAQQRVKENQMREEQHARYQNEQREAALKRALALRVRVPD